MKIALSGGGTGGHVYPALSVAAALRRSDPQVELIYLGRPGGVEERLVSQHDIRFLAVRSGQIRGQSPWRMALNAGQLALGIREAGSALAQFGADAVFATGGYASMPVILAAAMGRRPVTVFLPDVYPGWAVRAAALLADNVATTTDSALNYLPRKKTRVTGYPLRHEFWTADKLSSRQMLGLGEGPVLLVSGASSGSRALNDAVLASLEVLLSFCEVLHLTGAADEARVLARRDSLPESARRRYHVKDYLEEMATAMAAADLAVMRAGASCLAEPPALRLPAILVPGAFSDQHRNAAYMASTGAALMLDESRLPSLAEIAGSLLASPDRLAAMSSAAVGQARPNAAEDLAALLLQRLHADDVHEALLL